MVHVMVENHAKCHRMVEMEKQPRHYSLNKIPCNTQQAAYKVTLRVSIAKKLLTVWQVNLKLHRLRLQEWGIKRDSGFCIPSTSYAHTVWQTETTSLTQRTFTIHATCKFFWNTNLQCMLWPTATLPGQCKWKEAVPSAAALRITCKNKASDSRLWI